MNQQELATCHCIISHPTKPKFLAVKHSDRWSPPIVRFPPEGGLVAKAKLITDGVMNKYGFKTTVLRHLKSSPKYHCIELEMQSAKSSRKLEAVWVGSKEYAKDVYNLKTNEIETVYDELVIPNISYKIEF